MAFKFVVLATLLAVANAGFLGAPAAVGYAAAPAYGYAAPAYGGYATGYAAPSVASIGQNTFRSYGNLGQVSTYSKALDTPYSSVRKTDVRVSNDALAYKPAYAAQTYAAPAYASYAAPAYASYAAPAYAAQTYAAPVAAHYAAPAIAKVAAPGLGVAYSAAPVVSTMSFNGYGINYGW